MTNACTHDCNQGRNCTCADTCADTCAAQTALLSVWPLIADLDRCLRKLHPGMPKLEALTLVEEALRKETK